jgi:hypothetical protein
MSPVLRQARILAHGKRGIKGKGYVRKMLINFFERNSLSDDLVPFSFGQ